MADTHKQEPTHDSNKHIVSSGSDSGNHSASLECADSKEDSKCQSVWSIEDEEHYAREGMITFLSDPLVAMEHFRAGIDRGPSPLIHYGHAFVFFTRAMVSFSDTQQEEAYRLLEMARGHCHKARKSLPKGIARRLYYATLEHDCELFQAFLQFMKESMAGYLKGGLGIRSVWKSYAKTFKKAEKLFSSRPPIRPPFSDAESADLGSDPLEQLRGLQSDTSGAGLVEVDLGTPDCPEEEARVRRAVYMGYGLFHLILSLIPQKFLKVANLLGFQGDRRFGLECLHFGLSGKDMREPIAAINLLWFLTLLTPLISLSETADGKELRAVLSHLTAVSPDSPLARYFSARIALITKDLDVAMAEFKLAGQGSFFTREMFQVTCQDRSLVAMLQNNFELALGEIQSLLNSATKYLSLMLHICGLLTGYLSLILSPLGYLSDAREALKLFERATKQGATSANHAGEKFALRRCAYYGKQGITYVGMHTALLEHLYLMGGFSYCPPALLAANLESVQGSVAGATDPLARCMGLLAQGSILKYLGCPNEAEQSFEAILVCGPKQLKNDKHLLMFASIEMSVLARTHRRDAARAITFLHAARDKFGDCELDSRIQMVISNELSLSKALRDKNKTDN